MFFWSVQLTHTFTERHVFFWSVQLIHTFIERHVFLKHFPVKDEGSGFPTTMAVELFFRSKEADCFKINHRKESCVHFWTGKLGLCFD